MSLMFHVPSRFKLKNSEINSNKHSVSDKLTGKLNLKGNESKTLRLLVDQEKQFQEMMREKQILGLDDF